MTTWAQYQDQAQKYVTANPTQYNPVGFTTGMNLDQQTINAQVAGPQGVNPYTNWFNSLDPAQQKEYTAMDKAQFAAGDKQSRLMFAAAVGGMGLAGALGAGAIGGSSAGAGAAGGATSFPVASTGAGWGFTDIAGGAAAGASTAVPGATGVFADAAGAAGAGGSLTAGMTPATVAAGEAALPGAAAGTTPGSILSSLGGWQGVGSLVNTAGSLYGALKGSNTLSNLGKGTPAQQTANSQLNTLLQNPSSITSMPGYAAGLQAVERTGAAQGYLGSGNMMVGLDQYAGNFYNQTLQTLSGIGNANAGVNAEYTIGGMQLFGQGMNSLGGYLSKFGGNLPSLFSSLGLGG